ncbi:preprotein translocase subunit SecF [Paenibacillus sp. V4I9]|nr:preprotein translocase subunit SecF [Paenibacillus sp. V4I9]
MIAFIVSIPLIGFLEMGQSLELEMRLSGLLPLLYMLSGILIIIGFRFKL